MKAGTDEMDQSKNLFFFISDSWKEFSLIDTCGHEENMLHKYTQQSASQEKKKSVYEQKENKSFSEDLLNKYIRKEEKKIKYKFGHAFQKKKKSFFFFKEKGIITRTFSMIFWLYFSFKKKIMRESALLFGQARKHEGTREWIPTAGTYHRKFLYFIEWKPPHTATATESTRVVKAKYHHIMSEREMLLKR